MAVKYVALAARNILDVPGSGQTDLEAAALQNMKGRKLELPL